MIVGVRDCDVAVSVYRDPARVTELRRGGDGSVPGVARIVVAGNGIDIARRHGLAEVDATQLWYEANGVVTGVGDIDVARRVGAYD